MVLGSKDGATKTPSKKKNLPEKISRYIRKQILSGNIKAGTHLNEVAIAEQLGCSRSPVRDAVKMLESEGIVETLPTGRSIVLGFTLRDLTNLYDLRLDLEWKALKPLHEKGVLSFEQIAEIERILIYMERKNLTKDEIQHLDTMFHRKLVEASQNRPLFRVWSTLSQTIMTLQEITNEQKDQSFLADLAGVHRQIFASIKQGNMEETHRLIIKHCQNGLDIVSEVLEKNMTQKMFEENEMVFDLDL